VWTLHCASWMYLAGPKKVSVPEGYVEKETATTFEVRLHSRTASWTSMMSQFPIFLAVPATYLLSSKATGAGREQGGGVPRPSSRVPPPPSRAHAGGRPGALGTGELGRAALRYL
jgi:hypothetical protein